MDLKIDFLTKEIFIKIFSKSLGVLRTIFLLFLFGIGNDLDNFYLSKSIIGLVILVNILFETNYSHQLEKFINEGSFIKKFAILLNKLSFFLCLIILFISFFYYGFSEVFTHILIMSLWAILNINSNYFILIYRYKSKNFQVLLYYLLIAVFDILFLALLFFSDFFGEESNFVVISFSLLISEFLVFVIIFRHLVKDVYKFKIISGFKLNLELNTFYKIFTILVLIALIDITDKLFLSFLGEGQITYYTYGLYASLVIRQSLDVRSNFFVQINKLRDINEVNRVFFKTIKRLVPFLLLASLILIVILETLGKQLISLFKLDNFQLLKSIIYIGILITPFYMIWDLFYRLYYRNKIVNSLLITVSIGFFLNIAANYILSIYFELGLIGILISTLIIFAFYNFISYKTFFLS